MMEGEIEYDLANTGPLSFSLDEVPEFDCGKHGKIDEWRVTFNSRKGNRNRTIVMCIECFADAMLTIPSAREVTQ